MNSLHLNLIAKLKKIEKKEKQKKFTWFFLHCFWSA